MNLDAIVNAVATRQQGPLGHIDFFALTWQCSHVRFCRALWDADDYSREMTLAWVLQRNEEDYRANWIESLATSTCEPAVLDEISSSITTAAKEIEESDHIATPSKLPLNQTDLSNATAPYRIRGLSLYDYGPTAVYTWQRPSEFNYLELHYES